MELKLRIIKKCIISQDWIRWLNDKEVTKYSDNRLKKHSKSSQKEFLKAFSPSTNVDTFISSNPTITNVY